jgi:hypothetical protein
MTGWQPASSSRGPAKKGAVIELEPPERAVAVVQFGGLPKMDVHARNMATFISTNYGSAGAKAAKKFKMNDGKFELRRAVAASGNEELNIVRDIASAAKALKKDQASEKVIVLVLHGNDEGLSRIYRNGNLEDMLNADQLRDVAVYRMDLALLAKEETRKKAALDTATASDNRDAIEDAKFYLNDVRGRINDYRAKSADAAEMSEAFEKTAKALEDADVDVLELQACNVGDIEGMATFSFAGRLEGLLGNTNHTLTIRMHTRYMSSGVHSKTKKVMVWLGADPKRTDTNEISSTSLPPFVDTK